MKYVVNIISTIGGGNTIGSQEPIGSRDFENREFEIVSYPDNGGALVLFDRSNNIRIVISSIDYYSETSNELIVVTSRGVEFKFGKVKD